MWELKTARDLAPNRTYVVKGDYHASARKVAGQPAENENAVTFRAHSQWSYASRDEPVTLAPDQPVYILTCTCNGVAFIANRWTFTGECRCVHHPLPEEN
jgi:hypothetical protein